MERENPSPEKLSSSINASTAGAGAGFWPRARWVKIWLACVAWWFVFWWSAEFLIFAGPALGKWFVKGTPLRYLRINLWMPFAVSELPDQLARRPQFVVTHWAFEVVAAVLLLAGIAAWRASGTRRVLAGLALSVAAGAGMIASVTGFGRPHLTLAGSGALLVFFGAMTLGFWWMASGWCVRRRWVRIVSLLVAFELPLVVMLGLADIFGRGTFGPTWWTWIYLLPGAGVSFIVGRWNSSQRTQGRPARWRPIVNGVVISALLIVAVAKVGASITRGFEKSRLQDNREALAELPKNPVDSPYPILFFQKGVSFSAEWPDPYESQGAREMLLRLKNYGVNAIALVPYGVMRVGSPEVGGFGRNSMEGDEGLSEMARLAHALGMEVMLKPGIWVRGGKFAGDLSFPEAAQRAQFFANYATFIDRYAREAKAIHADLFCVGGEFVKLSTDQQAWRKIIAGVRRIYPGPLTYAANFGTEFETLKFWDALDYIGLQNYYPLPANLSTDHEVAKVGAVAKKYGKPVIFTEAGFPSAPDANQHPWQDGGRVKPELKLQAQCYQAIFQAFYSKPWFEGMYWWKIGTNGDGGPQDTSLTPWNKPAMQVVKEWYMKGER